MPRRRTTCVSLGRPEDALCSACKKPQLKSRCLLVQEPSTRDNKSAPRPPSTSIVKVNLNLSAPPHDSQGCVALRISLAISSGSASRALKRPQRYEPEVFWRYELPELPARMAIQEEHTRKLQAMADAALKASHDEGLQKGLMDSKKVVTDIEERLRRMAAELKKAKEEARKALNAEQEMRRKADATKRQKTLHMFFSQPLPHQARPGSTPSELGEGYTRRNITSGVMMLMLLVCISALADLDCIQCGPGLFAQHVKAVEILITQTAKDDPLKQLQLAAAVNQRLQGVRNLRERDQEAWCYIRNSLKAFFETLRDRYEGRYPNEVRAAQQAVCSAIANTAPPR